jgi:hypothetical protein
VEDIKFRKLRRGRTNNKNRRTKDSKSVLNRNFHITIPVGRPRTVWTDVVQRDSQQLLWVRAWRRKAANRDKWRHLMSEAKAQKGL